MIDGNGGPSIFDRTVDRLADAAAEAKRLNAAALEAVAVRLPGYAVAVLVAIPIAIHPDGNMTSDSGKVTVLAPGTLGREFIGNVEAAVKLWAAVARKQARAGRLVLPGDRP